MIDPAGHPRPFPPVGSRRASLVVATPPAPVRDPARFARWSRAMTPTGVLAVVAPPESGVGAMLPGRIVAAARAAGLGYLQHVIAVRARLVGDELVPDPSPDEVRHTVSARAAGRPVQFPVHTDVLVFTRGHAGNLRVGRAAA